MSDYKVNELVGKLVGSEIASLGLDYMEFASIKATEKVVLEFSKKYGEEGIKFASENCVEWYFGRYLEEAVQYNFSFEGMKKLIELQPCMCTLDTATLSYGYKTEAEQLAFYNGVKCGNKDGICSVD